MTQPFEEMAHKDAIKHGLIPSPAKTDNEYAIQKGENLPNHTYSARGLGKFVRQGIPSVPQFRTRQEVYRYAAWILVMADIHLPDEEIASSFEEVKAAIENV